MQNIAIVGAGFSGTMVAVNMLRAAVAGTVSVRRIALIERVVRPAWSVGGVAYGTRYASHVLNVPAGRMSALPEEPDHFLKWARRQDQTIGGGTFVPRVLYGRYLAWLLDEAESGAAGRVEVDRVGAAAFSVRVGGAGSGGGVRIGLDRGDEVVADGAVLAIGNYPPADPSVADMSFYASTRYVRDPWSVDALEVATDAGVALLGTGLTMLDVALGLRDREHRGPIYAISRRGLLPQPHRVSIRPPTPHARPAGLAGVGVGGGWPRTTRGLLRAMRDEVARAARKGVDWREVITSLRADTPALWKSLSVEERRRFLAHVRPFWETHRHRAAPSTAVGVEDLIAKGQLHVIAARLEGYQERPDGVRMRIRERGASASRTIDVARVVNCTGPETDVRRVRDPLVADLCRGGLVRPDELGLGLETDDQGALIARDGAASDRLFLVGPLRKGRLWENTAVPELRVEAAGMAKRLATATPVVAVLARKKPAAC